jgi:microbial collagenase
MNWFQKILQALGLASYDDESTDVDPVVTVKLMDSINLGLNQGDTLTPSQLAAKVGASDTDTVVKNIASAYSDAVFARMLEPISPADVDTYVNAAKVSDPTYEPPNFNNFLEIACPPGFDTEPLVTALKAWTGVVEFAGRNPDTEGSVSGTGEPLFSKQDYLSATNGVNAPAAWAKGADGTDTFIVDIEKGWFLQHGDLPSGITLRQGTNSAEIAHGTRVLGILVAQENQKGIVGLAPKATVALSSAMGPGSNADHYINRLAQRIFISGMVIVRGDVMLIEQQITSTPTGKKVKWPVESFWPILLMIRLVVAHGVIVVEGAGNGGVDLDNWADIDGVHMFNRGLPKEFQDSGAIMVGACEPGQTSYKYTFTNFGSRIDCCAQGDLVITCDFDLAHPNRTDLYTDGTPGRDYFDGTSSASAVIAGCCLLIQHLQTLLKPKTPGKLDSRQMRTLLSNPANCGLVGKASDMIKAVPDLGKIIANEYNP